MLAELGTVFLQPFSTHRWDGYDVTAVLGREEAEKARECAKPGSPRRSLTVCTRRPDKSQDPLHNLYCLTSTHVLTILLLPEKMANDR
jgi:hypothetical protein